MADNGTVVPKRLYETLRLFPIGEQAEMPFMTTASHDEAQNQPVIACVHNPI